ncbi:response regulator [Granulicella sp. 5B5]|uniref:LytR/AlgR family response regulator transcription factor n=1 Tax=Granulicella sp. 5B5 TaxID=1617967 RepID=UPI0015F55607|nr:LytTR family DNA-binding domain-containing protein [Granulicella sp. 5B5]QMV18393.1 response regulator [Granulicella sp. 5B5]
MTIKAIIADDEPLTRRSILRMLRSHPEFLVQAECNDGLSAAKAITRLAPDVVFLDVQMPGFDGLQVIAEIGLERMPLTVFVTAHAQYAVQAFEGRAVDYLLKPFGQVRFDETIRRIEDRLTTALLTSASLKAAPGTSVAQTRYMEWIPVNHKGRISPLKVGDVDWIQAEKNNVLIHVGDRVEVIRRTLHSLAKELDPRKFLRIHRSTIVNVEKIAEVQTWQNGYHRVRLQSGELLRMSRYQLESARLLTGRGGQNKPDC